MPSLEPAYVLDDEFAIALAVDVAEHGDERLIGTASSYGHWERQADVIEVSPPPPSEVPLVTVPQQAIEKESDLQVAQEIRDRRLTIVGGRRASIVLDRICDCFTVDAARIRWLEAEPNKGPNLDALQSVRSDTDVVVCITGAIGHAESEMVARYSRRGGIEPILVERRSEIEAELRARYGRSGQTR